VTPRHGTIGSRFTERRVLNCTAAKPSNFASAGVVVLQTCLSGHSPVLCVPYTAESSGDEFRSDAFGLNAVASSVRHTSATAVSAVADRTENNPHITNFTPYHDNICGSHRSKRRCKFLSNICWADVRCLLSAMNEGLCSSGR
jgi:hypothetical protein